MSLKVLRIMQSSQKYDFFIVIAYSFQSTEERSLFKFRQVELFEHTWAINPIAPTANTLIFCQAVCYKSFDETMKLNAAFFKRGEYLFKIKFLPVFLDRNRCSNRKRYIVVLL